MEPLVWGMRLMILPTIWAGFFLGSRGALLFAVLGSGFGIPAAFFQAGMSPPLAGSWLALGFTLFLLWKRRNEFHQEIAQSRQAEGSFRGRFRELEADRGEVKKRIIRCEGEIQKISEVYDLSKRFLGTLDLTQALEVTGDLLLAERPSLGDEERRRSLSRIQAMVEEASVSQENCRGLFPDSVLEEDPAHQMHWKMVSGQLALGFKRISLYRQVQTLAIHDGLTGLFVRRHFLARLREEVDRARSRNAPLAFLMVDIDHFKRVNDTHGHLAGDAVLREVARLIKGSLREIDLVGRYGGEEFAVALPETTRDASFQVAERIREAIEKATLIAYDEKFKITVSIGAALTPEDAQDPFGLIECADSAMYQAKGMGRNKTVLFRGGPS